MDDNERPEIAQGDLGFGPSPPPLTPPNAAAMWIRLDMIEIERIGSD